MIVLDYSCRVPVMVLLHFENEVWVESRHQDIETSYKSHLAGTYAFVFSVLPSKGCWDCSHSGTVASMLNM